MIHISDSPVSKNNCLLRKKCLLECPACGTEDIEASNHAPQPTYGWGCKCNQCGMIFSQVENNDWPFSYDFSGM